MKKIKLIILLCVLTPVFAVFGQSQGPVIPPASGVLPSDVSYPPDDISSLTSWKPPEGYLDNLIYKEWVISRQVSASGTTYYQAVRGVTGSHSNNGESSGVKFTGNIMYNEFVFYNLGNHPDDNKWHVSLLPSPVITETYEIDSSKYNPKYNKYYKSKDVMVYSVSNGGLCLQRWDHSVDAQNSDPTTDASGKVILVVVNSLAANWIMLLSGEEGLIPYQGGIPSLSSDIFDPSYHGLHPRSYAMLGTHEEASTTYQTKAKAGTTLYPTVFAQKVRTFNGMEPFTGPDFKKEAKVIYTWAKDPYNPLNAYLQKFDGTFSSSVQYAKGPPETGWTFPIEIQNIASFKLINGKQYPTSYTITRKDTKFSAPKDLIDSLAITWGVGSMGGVFSPSTWEVVKVVTKPKTISFPYKDPTQPFSPLTKDAILSTIGNYWSKTGVLGKYGTTTITDISPFLDKTVP